jgi:hypothetical protein
VAPKLNTTADGSLYLSVLDLIAWDKDLGVGAMLSRESWEQAFTPVKLNSGNRPATFIPWETGRAMPTPYR